MDDNLTLFNDLRKYISSTEMQISELDEEIKNISAKKTILEENEKLRQEHNKKQLEILERKDKINELNYQMKINKERILKIKNENNDLRSRPKVDRQVAERIKEINDIINNANKNNDYVVVIKKSQINQLNREIFEDDENNIFEEEDLIGNKEKNEELYKENNNNIYKNSPCMEKLNKSKIEYERIYMQLKEKCKQYHDDLEQVKCTIENYKVFLNEIHDQLSLTIERNMIMGEMDEITININEKETLEFIDNQMQKISLGISTLNNIYFYLKENFGLNVEHLLSKIYIYLKSSNKNKYKNDKVKLSIIIMQIKENAMELQEICDLFEKNQFIFYAENKKILKEITILQNKIKQEKIIKNKIDKKKLFNSTDFKSNNINEDNKLAQSFLIEYKNQNENQNQNQNKIDENNFDDIEEFLENYINEPRLVRKNWIEKCYIYDDFDVHDIVYDIKAVTNDDKLIFKSCSFSFDYDKIIKIKYLTVDDVPVPHTKKLNSIEFQINLYNSQTSKIHIIYQESKDSSKLNQGEIEERKIYREGKYGLKSNLFGKKAKYSLILRGSFVIVNFSEYFLIKNKENSKSPEYFWEGIVPYNGKITNIHFSKSEAIWSFSVKSKIIIEKGKRITIYYKKKTNFIGGNNKVIEINTYSPQTEDIFLDEEKFEYIITYNNVEKEAEFIVKGKFKNKCQGEWNLKVTDKQIEDNIQITDKMCKPELKNIAEEIIKDFDSNNKNNDFKFLDYMKIGLWVHKNIKYDLKYIGKDELTSLDIYHQKAGVSHHFTQLTNALLYSLGYKVIYIRGYLSQNNKEFNQDSSHSWSLIKLNNKWYPFDSTLGIFSGKLPISHIFDKYFYKILEYDNDKLKNEKEIVSGKCLN